MLILQCDEKKPSCNNCIRRQQICPGYADVFDGAHRSQNHVVIRRLEKQNAARDADSTSSTPSSDASLELTPFSSRASTDGASTKPTRPLQWIIYSSTEEERGEDEKMLQLEKAHLPRSAEFDTRTTQITIPVSLRQSPEDASVNFFFRHYTGTIYDYQLHNSLPMLWQPLYLASAVNSPLRLATAAVTVNITMMWSFKGCDARPARKLFTQALTATRQAIDNPSEKAMDELLLTILIFDLYDALVLHYVRNRPHDYGKHKDGALALLRHRGEDNFSTQSGRMLANATRNGFIGYCLDKRIPMPAGSEAFFSHPSLMDSKSTQLESLASQIINTQARLWAIRRGGPFARDIGRLRQAREEIIADAIRIDELMMSWRRGITAQEWLPHYISREDVAPSILAAGFYGSRCAVWVDLIFAQMSNIYTSQRLLTLQIIRQALADEPSLLVDPKYRAYLAKANTTVQSLADSILETVPMHLGDTVVPTNPIYSSGITFPYKVIKDPLTGEKRSIPPLQGTDFKMKAAAAGGWNIFGHLVDLYRLAEPEDDAEPLNLRDGQLNWIKGQVKRLQTTFLYSDPVW
ncbi:hypothetical protein H2200_005968 [Cladophialophora chaetospira]|uniref:Zn(2)-C6 fungal-type domain-containing protein n=1 Tax=Cladophialophora chaetospira TaxID=386627 RepID=A0AA38XAM3_9EURO|nr:hypothetical protein H2200_005968 [Cladophialophora chaetospira]